MPITTLYHGTTEMLAKMAPVAGLKPYSVPHNENEPAFSSEKEGTITLTNVYGAYQAFMSSDPKRGERWAIMEINLTRLRTDNLSAHELAKGAGKTKGNTWHRSLESVGLCVYKGQIPAKAISKVWIYNPASNWMITRSVLRIALGPAHYSADQKQLAIINRWLTGEFVTLDEWLAEQKAPFTKEQAEQLNDPWNNRSGLDLFYHGIPEK